MIIAKNLVGKNFLFHNFIGIPNPYEVESNLSVFIFDELDPIICFKPNRNLIPDEN